jgi:hypothetical protein
MEDDKGLISSGESGEFGGSRSSRDPAACFATMSDSEVEDAVLGLKRHENLTSLWLHHAIAEYDRRKVAEREYVLTTRQWLRRFCRMSASVASRTVATARALSSMPHVAKLGSTGDIPPEAVQQLATAQRNHPDEFPLHEPVFADIASYLGPKDLRVALSHWRQQIEGGGTAAQAVDRIKRRRLTLSQTFEGMWHQEGLLDPESGHIVNAALRSIADPANLDPDDHRTRPQRMVDAAVDICRFWLDNNTTAATSGGAKPHVTVTIDYETLTRGSDRLPNIDGTPVPFETMRRLLCDARITRIVTDGESQPLDVGRTVRTVTPAIRRALDLRDNGCTWNGCDAPTGWCDAHHIEHWADGGDTSLDNTELLCRRHHTATHEGRRPRHRPISSDPPDP